MFSERQKNPNQQNQNSTDMGQQVREHLNTYLDSLLDFPASYKQILILCSQLSSLIVFHTYMQFLLKRHLTYVNS